MCETLCALAAALSSVATDQGIDVIGFVYEEDGRIWFVSSQGWAIVDVTPEGGGT
jgi:hypothetical protein